MTKQQKTILDTMHSQGIPASSIVARLGISVNTVRSHLRRHPPVDCKTGNCRQCGRSITQPTGRKVKNFCSDRCRNAWWNSHQGLVNRKAYYKLICQFCGKEFTSYGNSKRKYCSRLCFTNSRKADSVPDTADAA